MSRISKEMMKEEVRKCGSNPAYFLKNYVKITHKEKGLIPFTTFDYQDQLLDDFKNHNFNIILKSRQLGISTIVAGYAAWMLLFRREKQVMVVATKLKTAANIVIKVKKMLQSIPEWMMISEIVINNQTSFELSNGSKITASATSTKDAGRSEALSLLIIDEAAHVEGMDEMWTSIAPTITGGGSCVALSSPAGVGGWFYKTFTAAQAGENLFNPIVLPWDVHPERDEEWFRNETKNMSRREIAQEYECFDGDTKIFTDRGLRNIRDLAVGDLVLTHKGRFKPIVKTRSKKATNIYKINSYFNRKFSYVTGEHPFYNENNEWQCLEDVPEGSRLCVLPKNITFTEEQQKIDLLQDIKPNNFKIKQNADGTIYQNDRRFKTPHNRFINVDYDFGKFIGLYMSEGWVNKKQTNLSFSFNYKTELNTWIGDLENYINETFGVNTCKTYSQRNSNSGILLFSSPIIIPLIKKIVDGSYSYDKRLSKYAYYIANKHFLRGVLDGIFIGDGCLKKQYDKIITITSLDMIYDIKYILSILGNGYNSICEKNNKKFGTIQGRQVSLHQQYSLKMLRTANKEVKNVSDLIENNIAVDTFETLYKNKYPRKSSYSKKYNNTADFFTSQLLTKEKIEDEIEVFNISVEEDESYVTEHFVVHNCSFNMSGETVISADDISHTMETVKEPIHRTGFDRNYWIWESPKQGVGYLISADVSRGDGTDNSVFHIFRIDTFEQVAEYQGKPNHDIFAIMLNSVGREYGDALMVVENNSIGFNVLDKLSALEYPNIYYSTKSTHEFVDQYTAEFSEGVIPGFSTTSKTRPLIIAKFEEFVRNKIIKINSQRTLRELETFVWNNGKPEAMRNYNDDLILSMSIACWVKDIALTTNKRETAYVEAILNSMRKTETKVNTAIPGMVQYNRNQNIFETNRNKAIEQAKEFFWLYKG